MKSKHLHTDILIVGSGLAGLSFAINIANKLPNSKVLIITKNDILESNSRYAQGGIALSKNNSNSIQKHIDDTIIAGDYHNDKKIVEMVVHHSTEQLTKLEKLGINFDKNITGNYNKVKEGGHSQQRIFHTKDATGLHIQEVLINKVKSLPNIEIITFQQVIDLEINDNNKLNSINVLNLKNKSTYQIYSQVFYLATGGIGQIFKNTTNPPIATGDGIAMAIRANIETQDIEFVQFHPTALFDENENPNFLISEAVRGAGAKLINHKSKYFMEKYHPLKELAPRDIVSRAIKTEIDNSQSQFLYLDCRNINKDFLINNFPNIYNKCLSKNINISKDLIPIVPVAHYLCGGIKVNKHSQTKIPNLFIGGESACTGLHGANRLASNSLLEAIVFSENASEFISNNFNELNNKLNTEINTESNNIIINQYSYLNLTSIQIELINNLKRRIKEEFSNNLGILKSNQSIENTKNSLIEIEKIITNNFLKNQINEDLLDLKNMLTVCFEILKASKNRTTNCGVFYNIDNVN